MSLDFAILHLVSVGFCPTEHPVPLCHKCASPTLYFLLTHATSKVFLKSTLFTTLIGKHAIVKKNVTIGYRENHWERNLSKYHTSLHLRGWDSVRVSHGSKEWARERLPIDIPQIEMVEHVVIMVRARPHIHVDFLTIWNSIDKSSASQLCMHVYSNTVCALHKHPLI